MDRARPIASALVPPPSHAVSRSGSGVAPRVSDAADGYPAAPMDLFLAACQGLGLALAAGALAGAPGRRGAVGTVLLIAAAIAGGVLFGISLAAGGPPGLSRMAGRRAGSRRSPSSSFATSPSRRRAAADGGGSHRGPDRRSRRSRSPGSRSSCSPVAIVALVGLVWIWLGRRRSGGAQVRGPQDPAVTASRKLVLCVVDSLRTDMLAAAAAAGDAPTFAALLERGSLIGDCVSSFPSVTPVCCSEIVTGAGPDRHWISAHELVSPRRAALRRVRQLVRGDPRLRALPLALRHRLQHEHGPPLPRGGDRVRDASATPACAPPAPRF